MTRPKQARTAPPLWQNPALWLVAAIAVYALLCWKFLFVQDDAFISYRYVANALNGHGLVYNIGERVEGFTNFGWVVILLLAGKVGFNIIPFSMILGAICGAAILVVTWLIARTLLAGRPAIYTMTAVFLVAVNGALAYWSPAGLETACFALMVTLSLYLYLTRNWLLIASLLVAVWMRPDGALVAALLIAIEAILRRGFPRFSFSCGAIAFLFSLPSVGFKLLYYGSILPNPFYAKTSFDSIQIINGLSYTGEFLLHYGFLGLGLLVPLIFFRKLSESQRTVLLFVIGFGLYVTVIGGDVLKVHRFYLPIFGASATLVALSLSLVLERVAARSQQLVAGAAALVLFAVTWFVPLATIKGFLEMERGFVSMMRFAGQKLQEQDSGKFTVATSTIGALGHTLLNHRIIDLVGLTDSTIARHPQTDISGITSTWKEQSFNASYVLHEAPEYIVFATGAKPSSPAEQALFLYDGFLDSYRTTTLAYVRRGGSPIPRPYLVYRKVRTVTGTPQPKYPVAFVSAFKRGHELAGEGKHVEAMQAFNDASRQLNGRQYPELMYQQAYSFLELGKYDEAYDFLNRVLEVDSLVAGPHRDLYMTETVNGDTAKAAIHRRFLQLLSPGDLRPADSLIREVLRTAQK